MKRIEIASNLLRVATLVGLPYKISYAVSRTRPQLVKAQDETEKSRKAWYTDKAQKYIDGAQAIARDHAKVGLDGQPAMNVDRTGFIINDLKAFDVAIKAFDDENEEGQVAFKVEDQALADYLREEVVIHRWAADLNLLGEAVNPETGLPRSLSTQEVILLNELIDFDPITIPTKETP